MCLLHAAVFVLVGVELPEDCRGRWETFVDQTLSEANRKNTIDLVIMHILFNKNQFCSSEPFHCDHYGFILLSRLGLDTYAHPQMMTWRVHSLRN